MVDDAAIAAVLAEHTGAEAVYELWKAAMDKGGPDNITARPRRVRLPRLTLTRAFPAFTRAFRRALDAARFDAGNRAFERSGPGEDEVEVAVAGRGQVLDLQLRGQVAELGAQER